MLPAILKKIQSTLLPTTSSNSNNITNNITNTQTNNVDADVLMGDNNAFEIVNAVLEHSPHTLGKIIYNIVQDNPYAIFLFVVMSVFLLTVILRLFIYAFTQRENSSKRNIWRRLVNTLLSSRFVWTGFLLGILVGIDILAIPKPFAHFIKGCIFSILLWILFHVTSKLLSIYTRAILIFKSRGTRLKFFKNKNIFIVLSRALSVTWFLIFITVLLGLWGVELGPILAGLGIVGIVVGLALQDSLSHVVGGVSLMLDETYSEGDYVILDNNFEGIIFQIGYRSTKIRTFDEEIIIVPNGALSKMVITNLSQPIKRTRINSFYLTFSVDATPERVKELLLEATKATPHILSYPEPYVFLIEPRGNQYYFRLSFYVDNPMNKLSYADLVHRSVVAKFAENNIRFGMEEKITHLSSGSTSHFDDL